MGRNITLEAGAWVMDRDHMRRIVTYMDGNAVLEIWNNGSLLQYCVAQGIRIMHEEFTWMNGTYFICSDFKSPALALVRAMSHFAELNDIRPNGDDWELYARKLCENTFEIARIAECKEIDGTILAEDSRELFSCVYGWAKQFEQDFDPNGGKDYVLEIEHFASALLEKTFKSDPPATSAIHSIHFTLPNGVRIRADLCGDARNPDAGNGWASLDISAVFPDGRAETLCCVDFEDQNEAGLSHGLRVLAYKPEDDEPSIVQPYPVENWGMCSAQTRSSDGL